MRNAVLSLQTPLVLLCALAFWLVKGESALLASIYGGGVALGSSWLLGRRIVKVGELAKTNPRHGVYSLYFGAVQRFVLVLVALGVGLGALALQPIPLLVTFGVAQVGYVFAAGKHAATSSN